MNEVSRSLRIFLPAVSGFILASTPVTGARADNSTTVLKGGTEDAEKMQKSVKLMVPDPSARVAPVAPAVTSPSPFQTGRSTTDLIRRSIESQEFQEQAAANRAYMLQRRQEAAAAAAAEAAHQAMIERHFGTETVTNVTPTRSYLAPTRGGKSFIFPRASYPTDAEPQVDPWTDVSAVPFRQKKLAELQASIKQLRLAPPPASQSAVAVGKVMPGADAMTAVAAAKLPPVPLPQTPLKAVEMMLPMAPPPKDWDAWYKRVATAIYDRWRQNTAGPGTAVVLITVYASRDIDCRVTDFTPAEGASSNGVEESRFKQISLQCVDGLSGDEIWQFPAVRPLPKKIVFDMEFKHAVGEDSGCRIVHLHNQMQESAH